MIKQKNVEEINKWKENRNMENLGRNKGYNTENK